MYSVERSGGNSGPTHGWRKRRKKKKKSAIFFYFEHSFIKFNKKSHINNK